MKIKRILFTFLLLLASCQSSSNPQQVSKFTQTIMTIDYHIWVGGPLTPSKKEQIQQIITATFQEIDDIYNKWNPTSEISRFNQHPAGTPFHLSPQLYHFLLLLDHFVQLSQGRFDPTVEPLQKLWKENLEQGKMPKQHEINELIPSVGWNTLHLTHGLIQKEDARTEIDLGAVAKGLCVDLLIDRLNQADFQNLFIEWGGEIRTSGHHPSGRPWHVYISGLANPAPSAALAELDVIDKALATSGDYFQCWEIITPEGEKKTYCHIFNPITLTPLEVKEGSIASASLLADDCVTADALATVLMTFDSIEEAHAWFEKVQKQLPHLECWLATAIPAETKSSP